MTKPAPLTAIPARLVPATVDLLIRKNGPLLSYADIAEATGLPRAWIKAVRYGRISDPSARRIEILHYYLSGKSLDI